jgi:hypothetical protein
LPTQWFANLVWVSFRSQVDTYKFLPAYICTYVYSGPDGKIGQPGRPPHQGCQMVYFETKNTNLGKFWRGKWKMLVNFTIIWYNLWPFGIMYGRLG